MRRFASVFLVLTSALAAGCSHELGPDETPSGHSAESYARIRQQQELMDDLTALAGGECDVEVLEETVLVRFLPGSRDLPGATTLRKM